MSELVEVVGRVANGRLDLHVDEIRALNQGVKRWEGKTVRLTVRPARRTRSDGQNRFLWGVAYALLEEGTGTSAEDFHEFFKLKFLSKELALADANGEIYDGCVIGGSTAKLDTGAFMDFTAKIRAWALEMPRPIVIPEPNETV
jgi:hypothetical protein